eukprot:6492161-Amphidinium_carterae.2
MAAPSRSEAFFNQRLVEIGVPEDMQKVLKEQGFTVMERLNYCVSSQPGQGDDGKFVELLEKLSGKAVSEACKSAMRQMYAESQATVISELRARFMPDAVGVQQVPSVERSARLKAQQERLPGLEIKGELEPGTSLLLLVAKIKDSNEVSYIPPDKCISRAVELSSDRKEQKRMVLAVQGKEVIVQEAGEEYAVVDTELHLKNALTRRGLALDQFNVLDFQTHSRWIEFLYQRLARVPYEGARPVTVQQIIAADKALWLRIAELTRDGVAPNASGALPVAVAMAEARQDPEVSFALMPRFGGQSGASSSNGKGAGSISRASGAQKRTASVVKGAPKKKPLSIRMPPGLQGLKPTTAENVPICYAYNLQGCLKGVDPKTNGCDKGKHVCMRCGSDKHGAAACPKSAA